MMLLIRDAKLKGRHKLISDESEKQPQPSEPAETSAPPEASPPAPRRLTPYTPPLRVAPPPPPPPPALPVQFTPAPPALPPVPRPAMKTPARPAHRLPPVAADADAAPRREARQEPVEVTRLTAPPKTLRSAQPALPPKVEEEPTRVPTRPPAEKQPKPPAEVKIDAPVEKPAPPALPALPVKPPPLTKVEPSEQTSVVKPPPIPTPPREAVLTPWDEVPADDERSSPPGRDPESMPWDEAPPERKKSPPPPHNEVRAAVKTRAPVEPQAAIEPRTPPADATNVAAPVEVPVTIQPRKPENVQAKESQTVQAIEVPAPVKPPIEMSPVAAEHAPTPATRPVRVPAKQKRIEPAYPAARLLKGDGTMPVAAGVAELVATARAEQLPHADAVATDPSAPSATVVAANVATPVGQSELPWWIRSLAGPALVRVKDRWLSSGERFAAEHWVGAVTQAVGAVIGQRITWEWAGGSIDADGQAFGVLMSAGDAAGEEFMVGVDGALARAIVSRVTAQFAQLRGAGDSISDAEAGVLEFVALTAADRLADPAAQGSAEAPMGVVFKQFLTGAEAVTWGSRSAVGGLSVQAVVGPQAGLARIWLPRSVAKGILQQVKRTPPMPAAAEAVLVSIQLPEIALTEAEWDALAPGDLLMLGLSKLVGVSSGLRLVTSNGWSLCEAECVVDSPTLIAAECGSLHVAIDPACAAGAAGSLILRATLGQASLATAHLARWKSGTRIELTKNAQTPIELWHGPERVGRGEMVSHDGEKAIHVLEWGTT